MGAYRHRIDALRFFFGIYLMSCAAGPSMAQPQDSSPKANVPKTRGASKPSSRSEVGKASYYSEKFAGKKMANGRPMNPDENIAASKTLPLGTKAKVTNLENGKSVEVKIEDRGPYVPGRIVDLSPKAAEKLDIKKRGVAAVAVTPVAESQSSGNTSAGASNAGTGAAGGK
jgi:rare lipoprotein A